MRIATFNICGWKSAIKKGLLRWVKQSEIDILAIQELRTEKIVKPLELAQNYNMFFNPSKFHGTAIITKGKPLKFTKHIGHARFDREGRFIQLEFEEFMFINAYMPHGGRDKRHLPYKLEAYQVLIKYLSNLLSKTEKPVILAGDFNVAHREVDLARPRENENNIMFTKEEREQIDKIIELGFVDSFRRFHQKNGYTWWLRAFNSKKRNIGWRIDYIFVSKHLERFLKNAFVPSLEISDHCPVVIEIKQKPK
jgi:exodeoxyribonuclease-3